MGLSKDERQALVDFGARYSVASSGVLENIERRVIGDVWGANGYTTVTEADRLAAELALDGDKHVLDVGSGRGWPGLYFSKSTRCRTTLTDLPYEGLHSALSRAARELLNVTGAVIASGKALPFADGSFDAVVHTDVLC